MKRMALKNILDPLSKSHKRRPRKNKIKPASRQSKKKSDHNENVLMRNTSQNQAQQFTQTQVGVETFTQESVVSNPYMLQS